MLLRHRRLASTTLLTFVLIAFGCTNYNKTNELSQTLWRGYGTLTCKKNEKEIDVTYTYEHRNDNTPDKKYYELSIWRAHDQSNSILYTFRHNPGDLHLLSASIVNLGPTWNVLSVYWQQGQTYRLQLLEMDSEFTIRSIYDVSSESFQKIINVTDDRPDQVVCIAAENKWIGPYDAVVWHYAGTKFEQKWKIPVKDPCLENVETWKEIKTGCKSNTPVRYPDLHHP